MLHRSVAASGAAPCTWNGMAYVLVQHWAPDAAAHSWMHLDSTALPTGIIACGDMCSELCWHPHTSLHPHKPTPLL